VREYADRLQARGQTAIYSALTRALEVARAEAQAEPERYMSIVLLTDGESNSGIRYQEFRHAHAAELSGAEHVRIFTILFGEAAADEMRELAEWTGGRAFDARKSSLASAFKEIRGYQ
jgi:Ca-activated chloride channel family protein